MTTAAPFSAKDEISTGSARLADPKPSACLVVKKTSNLAERLAEARRLAKEALKHKRVFAIEGNFPSVRQELLSRGWVENLETNVGYKTLSALDNGLWGTVSRLVRHRPPDFIWRACRPRKRFSDAQEIMACPAYLNFNTKSTLVQVIRNVGVVTSADPDAIAPRAYRMHREKEANVFYQDFLFTACVNILKTATQQTIKEPAEPEPSWSCQKKHGIPKRFPLSSKLQKEEMQKFHTAEESYYCVPPASRDLEQWMGARDGNVPACPRAAGPLVLPMELIRFAARQVRSFLEVVDEILYYPRLQKAVFPVAPADPMWATFLKWTYLVRQFNPEHVSIDRNDQAHEQIIEYCASLLDGYSALNPLSRHEGTNNIWIVKPGSKSRGIEITVSDNLEEITEICYNNQGYPDMRNFVVQKYIERPFLCHNTKFDIRQWFLVTWHPLSLWMYQDCYLRFSSSHYSLSNLDEKVHLTNNAVQGKYFGTIPNQSNIPKECMWRRDGFIDYLTAQGMDGREVWDIQIFPEIIRLITLVLVSSAAQMDQKSVPGYELFGADFILTEDLKPWLIEINSGPDLSPSTSITAAMCPQVVSDCLKVLVDHLREGSPRTGKFRLAYQLHYTRTNGKAFKVKSGPLELMKPTRAHRLEIAQSRGVKGTFPPGVVTAGPDRVATNYTCKEAGPQAVPDVHYSTLPFIQEGVRELRRERAMRRFKELVPLVMPSQIKKPSVPKRSAASKKSTKSVTKSTTASKVKRPISESESTESDSSEELSDEGSSSFSSDSPARLRPRTRLEINARKRALANAQLRKPRCPFVTPRANWKRPLDLLRLQQLAKPKALGQQSRLNRERERFSKKYYKLPPSAALNPVLAASEPSLGKAETVLETSKAHSDRVLDKTVSTAGLPSSAVKRSFTRSRGDVPTTHKISCSKSTVEDDIKAYTSDPTQRLRLHNALKNALRRFLPTTGHQIRLLDAFLRDPTNGTLKQKARDLLDSVVSDKALLSASEIFSGSKRRRPKSKLSGMVFTEGAVSFQLDPLKVVPLRAPRANPSRSSRPAI